MPIIKKEIEVFWLLSKVQDSWEKFEESLKKGKTN